MISHVECLEMLEWYQSERITKAIAKGLCIEDKDMPNEAWKFYSIPFIKTIYNDKWEKDNGL